MKKFTNIVLYGIGVIGLLVVGQGWITGEEFTSIQSIAGYVLTGSGFTAGTVLLILKAIPQESIKWLFKKAEDTYGKEQVSNLVDTFYAMTNELKEVKDQLDLVNSKLDKQEEDRNNLLNG